MLYAVCWIPEDHVHGLGGTGRTDIGSAEDCKQECIRIRDCVAVDWEPANAEGKKCWILTEPFVLPTDPTVVFIHYALNPACRSQSSSASRGLLLGNISIIIIIVYLPKV